MIVLEIDNKEFKICNSYEELSLGQYIDIIKIGESKMKLEGNAADIEIISILSDRPEEIKPLLWEFNIDDFNILTSHFAWVADTTVLEHFKSLKPKEKVDIDGKPYGIMSDYNKMSLGEIVSFETILKQEQSDFHKLDIAFGVLLRPINDDGTVAKFTEEVFLDVIKNKYKVNMIDIYAVISFFLSGEKKSITKSTGRFSIRHS